MTRAWRLLLVTGLAVGVFGCERKPDKPKARSVQLALAPEVISTEDATLRVRATVFDGTTRLRGRTVRIQIAFTDQLGNLRTYQGTTADTDRSGSVEHEFSGLVYSGAGTVTAEVLDGDGEPVLDGDDVPVAAEASFAVIDLSPPVVSIDPSATTDNRVGPGLPLDVEVLFSDNMGVSEVILQYVGELEDTSSQIVASGTSSGTVVFENDIPGGAIPGPTITLYALAMDLSGNISAAEPVVLTVDPSIRISVPAGFDGTQLVAQQGNFLTAATALAYSPKNDMLYVADNSGGVCNGSCLYRVNPADGSFALLFAPGGGIMTGVAFDATGDNLFYSKLVGNAESIIGRLTFNAGAMTYQNPVVCNIPLNQQPTDPFHLVVDAGGDVFVADQGDQVLKSLDTANCGAGGTDPADLSSGLDTPWGVAQIPGGDFLVSDEAVDAIYRVTGAGVTSVYETSRMDRPLGLDWLGASTTVFADSLFVANFGNQRILATQGTGFSRTAATLADDPVDVAFGSGANAGSLFILTDGGGRIFTVTGY